MVNRHPSQIKEENLSSGEAEDLPHQHSKPNPIDFSPEEIEAGNVHIDTLLAKKAIVPVPHQDGQFFSNVYFIPKHDGGLCVILNLKKFNYFIQYHHFKMETLSHILSHITPSCYMAIFDFCDACLTVAIAGEHIWFLCFRWQGKTYMFVVLLFGISSAPRKFTKLLKPILALLRRQGIIILTYIDNGFTAAPTYELCFCNICMIMCISLFMASCYIKSNLLQNHHNKFVL